MIPLPVEAGEISYSDRGAGETVVLVHAGVFSDWFLPLSESRALDSFRVIRIRRAGYAGHEPSRHLTIADHAGHLARLADHLGLAHAHWVGHSSGCQIVLQLALDHPGLVKTLILIEPAAGGGFVVPAVEELGRRFVGPSIGAFTAGDLDTAFDLFMRGVCGEHYRSVLEQRLGVNAVDEAIRQSALSSAMKCLPSSSRRSVPHKQRAFGARFLSPKVRTAPCPDPCHNRSLRLPRNSCRTRPSRELLERIT